MSGAGYTPGPWAYRSQELDDWGMVRAAPDAEGRAWVICQARYPYCTEEELSEHRRNKTDPYEANARLIAVAPDMLEVLAYIEAGTSMTWPEMEARWPAWCALRAKIVARYEKEAREYGHKWGRGVRGTRDPMVDSIPAALHHWHYLPMIRAAIAKARGL